MTPQACAAYADWFGWGAGVAGAVGALLLVRPLFVLLRQREAIETIAHGNTLQAIPPAFKARLDRADKLLKTTAFDGREGWKPWAYGGAVSLAAGLFLLLLQAIYFVC